MGWSTTSGHEISDDGLEISTRWLAESKHEWEKTAKPLAADWLHLLDESISGEQEGSQATIKQLIRAAAFEIPDAVLTQTKAFNDNLNKIFNSKWQRDASSAEYFLHALSALTSENSTAKIDKLVFESAMHSLKNGK